VIPSASQRLCSQAASHISGSSPGGWPSHEQQSEKSAQSSSTAHSETSPSVSAIVVPALVEPSLVEPSLVEPSLIDAPLVDSLVDAPLIEPSLSEPSLIEPSLADSLAESLNDPSLAESLIAPDPLAVADVDESTLKPMMQPACDSNAAAIRGDKHGRTTAEAIDIPPKYPSPGPMRSSARRAPSPPAQRAASRP
jgi:hypothetical protein